MHLPLSWARPRVREPHCEQLEEAAAQKTDELADSTAFKCPARAPLRHHKALLTIENNGSCRTSR